MTFYSAICEQRTSMKTSAIENRHFLAILYDNKINIFDDCTDRLFFFKLRKNGH
jgi:hypothetical protein